jgi:XTP/dITP diphosphohydrolase
MKLVFATHNRNKLKEVQALLPKHIEILSLDDIGCTEEIPEEADTIEGNAMAKANYVKQKYGYDCFADDTGLEVSALNGAPGVYSARYAGPQKNDQDNVNKLLEELRGMEDRSARFKTVIALNLDRERILFQGIASGVITEKPKGKNGFGYDPVFMPDGYKETFAELALTEKNKISHRAKAMQALIEYFIKA